MSLGRCLPRHLLVLLLVIALQSFQGDMSVSLDSMFCLEKDDSYHAAPGSYKCVPRSSWYSSRPVGTRCQLLHVTSVVSKRITELKCMKQRGQFPSNLSAEYLKKPNLSQLHLRSNQIRRIETDAFQHAPQLEYIGLYDNNLSEVGLEFQNLAHLTYLHLADNQIRRINVDAFVGTNNLKKIKLYANGLKQIGFEFQNLKKLHAVYLPGDQIQPGKIDRAAFLNVDVNNLDLFLCDSGQGNWQGKYLELCSTRRSSEEGSSTIEATIQPICFRGTHVPPISCKTSKNRCHTCKTIALFWIPT